MDTPECPGLGVKRAAALFEEKGYSWKTVVEAFADKDLSEEVALENARLARILQCTDYDVADSTANSLDRHRRLHN